MRDWLGARAAASPDAPALVDATAGDRWTYAELDEEVSETAGRLAALGVGPRDHVGVLMETRPAFARLAFAVERLGAVLVPLNARLPPDELMRQREAAGVGVLVCARATESDAVAAAGDAPVASVDDPAADAVAAVADRAPADVDAAAWSRDDDRILAFTSGTTGDPKAVRLTAGNLLASATASAFRLGVDPGDRWLSPLSMYHVGGLAPLLRSTLYGTTTVIQRGFDADAAVEALDEYGCTGVSLVPTMLERMLDATNGGVFDSLRFVLLGGAPAPSDLIRRCETRAVPVHPTYGMTETASQIATARPDEAFANPDTVGRPILWTDVAVVDEDGTELPPGEAGELVVSGPTVTPGYYRDAAATADAFGERGLRTGDVGYRDAGGRLWVLNRRDDRILTGGESVDPGRVVAVLRDHPGVEAAAVVGLNDPEWGERVAALVVPAAGVTPTAAELRAHCEDSLAGFALPRTVAFAEALPRTASGTVDREAVRDRLRGADGS